MLILAGDHELRSVGHQTPGWKCQGPSQVLEEEHDSAPCSMSVTTVTIVYMWMYIAHIKSLWHSVSVKVSRTVCLYFIHYSYT